MPPARRALGLVVVPGAVIAALALSGCATETPVCDTASPLIESGRLAAATELYARASQAGEGSCAENGLAGAGEQYGRAYAEVAAGSADEVGGDVDAAAAHYETARRLDVGNTAAVAGLARLGQDATRVETPVTPPSPTPAGDDVEWWVLAAAVAGPLLAVAGGGYLLWRRLARIEATLRSTRDTVEEDLGEHQEQGVRLSRHLDALDARVAALDADRAARVAALDDGVGEMRRTTSLLHEALIARTTDQLRLLCLVREQTTPPTAEPNGTGEVVLHWTDEAAGADAAGADELAVVVLAAPRPGDGRRRLTLHDFRVRADGLDLAARLDEGAFRCALGELAARPGDPAAVADVAEHAGIDLDAREPRTIDAVEGDGMVVPRAEHGFWSSLDRVVLLRRPPPHSDLYVVAPSPRSAATISQPDLARLLLDGDEAGASALRHALDLALVDAAAGVAAPELRM